VEAPGLGDEVQAIKAGILEIADILVVNKADRPGVDKTVQALQMMLELEHSGSRLVRHHGQLLRVESPPLHEASDWRVPVLKTIAADGTGVAALAEQIDAHRAWLVASGELAVRERLRVARTLENILRAELHRRLLAQLPSNSLNGLVDAVQSRQLDPYTAAQQLLASW
jgi:LAO/AO transport system kinase